MKQPKYIKNKVKKWLGLIDIERRVDRISEQSGRTQGNLYNLRRQLTSLQALDVYFKESGKIILICRVGGRDKVKIIDINAGQSGDDYNRISQELEDLYGAKVIFRDGSTDLKFSACF